MQKWLRALCIAVLALVLIYDISAGSTYASLAGGFLFIELVYASHVGLIGGAIMSKMLDEESQNDDA